MRGRLELLLARTRARVAGNVKRFREALGLSIADAAEIADLTPPEWQAVERGELDVGLRMLAALGDALDVDPQEFLKPVPDMAQVTAASPARDEGGRSGKEGA